MGQIKSDTRDGRSRIIAYAGQTSNSWIIARKAAQFQHLLGCFLKIPCARIVAQPGPSSQQVVLFDGYQSVDIRESIEEALVIRYDRGDTRLLQHDLGNPDAIRIARAAPGQVALVLPVPIQNAAADGRK